MTRRLSLSSLSVHSVHASRANTPSVPSFRRCCGDIPVPATPFTDLLDIQSARAAMTAPLIVLINRAPTPGAAGRVSSSFKFDRHRPTLGA
uniref:Putative secreted peptide n=1 Tax=Anopheles braziliensis TaxID=58242 RepID=A0A2M3ZTQ6_9DIPT